MTSEHEAATYFDNIEAYAQRIIVQRISDNNKWDDAMQEVRIRVWMMEERLKSGDKVLTGEPKSFWAGFLKRTIQNFARGKRGIGECDSTTNTFCAYRKPDHNMAYMDKQPDEHATGSYVSDSSSGDGLKDYYLEPEPDFADAVVNTETLKPLLGLLSPTRREILSLLYWGGYTAQAIGDMLGYSKEGIYDNHRRAIAIMKNPPSTRFNPTKNMSDDEVESLVQMRITHNVPYEALAKKFDISLPTVSRIMTKWREFNGQ